MDLLRRASEADASYPAVLLISLASVEANAAFFAERWPEARVVSDPDKVLYAAFGRETARLAQMLGPRVVLRALLLLFRGYGAGKPQGDPAMMPGTFVLRGADVLFAHDPEHVGDHPDFATLGVYGR